VIQFLNFRTPIQILDQIKIFASNDDGCFLPADQNVSQKGYNHGHMTQFLWMSGWSYKLHIWYINSLWVTLMCGSNIITKSDMAWVIWPTMWILEATHNLDRQKIFTTNYVHNLTHGVSCPQVKKCPKSGHSKVMWPISKLLNPSISQEWMKIQTFNLAILACGSYIIPERGVTVIFATTLCLWCRLAYARFEKINKKQILMLRKLISLKHCVRTTRVTVKSRL